MCDCACVRVCGGVRPCVCVRATAALNTVLENVRSQELLELVFYSNAECNKVIKNENINNKMS